MSLDKSKQIPIIIILAASFLIEFPLRHTIISTLYIISPLNYLVVSGIFYVALLSCLLILLKPNITSKAVLKTICVVAAFLAFEEIMLPFFSNLNFVLVYEIIRPALIFGVIFWAAHWVLKSKVNINKVFLSIAGGLFGLRTVLCVINDIQLTIASQNIENDISAILDLFAATDSKYSMMAGLSTYALAFVMFAFIKEKIPAKTECENADI